MMLMMIMMMMMLMMMMMMMSDDLCASFHAFPSLGVFKRVYIYMLKQIQVVYVICAYNCIYKSLNNFLARNQ